MTVLLPKRASRERTKQQVAHLEKLVQTLRAANERPEQLSELLIQVDKGREEIRRLKDTLSRVHLLTVPEISQLKHEKSKHSDNDKDSSTSPNSLFDQGTTPPDDSLLQNGGSYSVTGTPSVFASQIFETPSAFSILDMPAPVPESGQYQVLTEDGDLMSEGFIPLTISPKPLDAIDQTENDPVAAISSQILTNPRLDGRWLILANSVLSHCLSKNDELMTPRILDDDIAIRACVEGWDIVRRRYYLDAGWRWLRQLDENMFFHLSWPTRMAIMKVQRTQYLVRNHERSCFRLTVDTYNRSKEASQVSLIYLVSWLQGKQMLLCSFKVHNSSTVGLHNNS